VDRGRRASRIVRQLATGEHQRAAVLGLARVSSSLRMQLVRRVWNACAVLTCEICSCRSESGKGWFGFIAEDPEDGEGSVVCTYCPPCAERELDARPRLPHYI
jgi:hypothetical protein